MADLLVRNSDAAYVPRVSMAIFEDRILAESAGGHGRDDDRFWADLTGHETTGHRRLYDVRTFLRLLDPQNYRRSEPAHEQAAR